MNLVNGFIPESQRVTINVESNLLESYYSNFKGIISEKVTFNKDIQVVQLSKCCAQISFPIKNIGRVIPVEGRDDIASVSVEKKYFDNIKDAINDFVSLAIRYKFLHTEFIPLADYPIEKLKDEIKDAAVKKRDLCIINNYKEYTDSTESNNYVYNQYIVKHDDPDYYDAILLVYEGDLKELNRIYRPKLTRVEWI